MTQTVVITGASSGIGEALALRYALDRARLGLLGRNRDRLEVIASRCRSMGADTVVAAIDVESRDEMNAWLEQFDRATPVDILIANAGVLAGRDDGQIIEAPEQSLAVFRTNVLGMLNTVHPLLPRMLARRRGTIGIMSSLAGFAPLAQMPSYSSSKAAVMDYGLALRDAVRPHGVGVCVICPGYIDTPMTAQIKGTKPFAISADDAAERIHRGLARSRAIIAFPWLFAIVTRISGILPNWLRRLTSSPMGAISPRR